MGLGAFDDLEGPRTGVGGGLGGPRLLIAGIGEDPLDEREGATGLAQNLGHAIAILDVGGVDDDTQEEAERVDEDVPLAPRESFTCSPVEQYHGRKRSNVMKQLVRDYVVLAYEEADGGDPPILLIHGGMNDHSHFAPQFEHFRQHHRTVAVDLRGHGRSGKPRQDYTIRGFGDDVAWLCNEIGLSGPVVVGHSMGGLVALDLAARSAAVPAAIVILDSPIVPPRPFADALRPFADELRGPGYREAIRRFMAPFVGFADDPGQRERLLADMAAIPQHVVES